MALRLATPVEVYELSGGLALEYADAVSHGEILACATRTERRLQDVELDQESRRELLECGVRRELALAVARPTRNGRAD